MCLSFALVVHGTPFTVEALNGTLRAAKRKGVITFEGQMLLQGAHDDVDVILLQDE
jgi:hypothetical protein